MNKRTLFYSLVLASLLSRAEDFTPNYVAHEWGTFTSVQGSDGVPLRWNPFQVTDLPGFVFDRKHPTHGPAQAKHAEAIRLFGVKTSQSWFQRMETPVIYFHARDAVTVDIHVTLPSGLITEWFPQVTSFGPVWGWNEFLPDNNQSHLRWNQVHVLSAAESLDPTRIAALTTEALPSHYYPARNTSANFVEITRQFAPEPTPQQDRLLFYRGAADFSAPLRVSVSRPETLELVNIGTEMLGPLFVLRVDADGAGFRAVEPLAPGARLEVPVGASVTSTPAERPDTLASVREAMRSALVNAGLFADEAAAMVATWQDTWFDATGLRVLYLSPREWTDRVLPIEFNPPPRDLVRVMVGRADVLDPATERNVATWVREFAEGRDDKAIAGLRRLDLGRFLEPAISRAGALLWSERIQNAPGLFSLGNEEEEALNAELWNATLARLKQRVSAAQDTKSVVAVTANEVPLRTAN